MSLVSSGHRHLWPLFHTPPWPASLQWPLFVNSDLHAVHRDNQPMHVRPRYSLLKLNHTCSLVSQAHAPSRLTCSSPYCRAKCRGDLRSLSLVQRTRHCRCWCRLGDRLHTQCKLYVSIKSHHIAAKIVKEMHMQWRTRKVPSLYIPTINDILCSFDVNFFNSFTIQL